MPPHVPYGLRGLPSRLWPTCSRLLRLGSPWGAVTLSWWGGCDIWIRRTRRGLKPKFYLTTQTMVTIGIFPFKEKFPWQNRESNPGPHDQTTRLVTLQCCSWNTTVTEAIHACGKWPLDIVMHCVVVSPCRAMCVVYVVDWNAAVSNLRLANRKSLAISFYAVLALLLFIL
jgi:hypothetical protein